ncbi:MAG: tRNA (adenosine(37)-N6)-threonylcarbamoyltransferase complex ATPase subunit type 1 TsaE [Dechloromonas sp.]|nr:tRNA (adenosine(37)-N6)-threonylcarbamoyltransferase complex ATPase subunit type 1 TsaE [Dechloromonas sp.]
MFRRPRGVGAREAERGETQFPPGLTDGFLQRRIIQPGVRIVHSTDSTAVLALPDEAATQRLGQSLAPALQPGMVIFLEGDLGAGKTTLVRALIRALGHPGPVKSPTYSLVEVYVVSSLYLYHFDFYRFESPEEFLDAGLDEYFHDNTVCLVEWPERAQGCVPEPDLRLRLEHAGSGRVLEAVARSLEGQQCIRAIHTAAGDGGSCAMPAPR